MKALVRRTALGAVCFLAALAAAAEADAPPVHNYRGVVPVLLYHRIDAVPRAGDPYAVSQAEFARQMAMLAADGFHTISIAQYARFAGGDVTALPDRPILITFDDGLLRSYEGADAILARYGMRATMFVITANAAAAKPGGQPLGAIQLLSGGNAGKELELTKPLTTLGKPGVQVAVIAKRPQGYFITHVEGATFPVVNGKQLDAQAHPLNDHDVIELAGVKMEFYLKPA